MKNAQKIISMDSFISIFKMNRFVVDIDHDKKEINVELDFYLIQIDYYSENFYLIYSNYRQNIFFSVLISSF